MYFATHSLLLEVEKEVDERVRAGEKNAEGEVEEERTLGAIPRY